MPLKGASARGRDQAEPVADEALTVTSGAAVGLAGIPDRANFTYAWLEVQNNPVRVRFVGDATGSLGHVLNPGVADVWNPIECQAARFIATGTDAIVFVTYYRDGKS